MKTYKLNNIEVSKQELQELIKNNPELLEKNDKNWRAKPENEYYYIDSFGIGRTSIEGICKVEQFSKDIHYETLNYFQAEEQAEAYRNYLLAVGRVSRAIWEANGDWEEDWENEDEIKYSLFYNYEDGLFGCEMNTTIKNQTGLSYIKSVKIAEQIIKDHKEDLMTIFNYKR